MPKLGFWDWEIPESHPQIPVFTYIYPILPSKTPKSCSPVSLGSPRRAVVEDGAAASDLLLYAGALPDGGPPPWEGMAAPWQGMAASDP